MHQAGPDCLSELVHVIATITQISYRDTGVKYKLDLGFHIVASPHRPTTTNTNLGFWMGAILQLAIGLQITTLLDTFSESPGLRSEPGLLHICTQIRTCTQIYNTLNLHQHLRVTFCILRFTIAFTSIWFVFAVAIPFCTSHSHLHLLPSLHTWKAACNHSTIPQDLQTHSAVTHLRKISWVGVPTGNQFGQLTSHHQYTSMDFGPVLFCSQRRDFG